MMKIRRYIGANTQEAILKVKMDLGSDAVIISTRKVRPKGFWSFLKKPLTEVIAAIDDDTAVRRESSTARTDEKQQQSKAAANNLEKKEEKIAELENKINSIEKTLLGLMKTSGPGVITRERAKDYVPETGRGDINLVLHQYYKKLVQNDVEEAFASSIADSIKLKMGSDAGSEKAAAVFHEMISGLWGKPEVIKFRSDGKPTVAMFVGPTGVGKTTTIAKLAADMVLNMKKKVGLITADTYRIAAVEQLKTYAEILGIPLTVIYSPEEIRDAIQAHADKDVILIDTAGRNHRNRNQFDELKLLVGAAQADEIYLLLGATMGMKSCRDVIDNYSFIKNYKLIFTKVDEALSIGLLLNVRLLTNRSLSYITTGQNVPDDLEVANAAKLTNLLMGSIM